MLGIENEAIIKGKEDNSFVFYKKFANFAKVWKLIRIQPDGRQKQKNFS
jgi:hypothetical protein